jgi:hypothetical protein
MLLHPVRSFQIKGITINIMTTAKRPWYMFYPLAGMLLLCMAWSGYWFVASNNVQQQLAIERKNMASEGADLQCGQETWGGFPFRFEFTCQNLSLVSQQTIITTPKLRAVAQAYNPFHILLLIDGPTNFAKGDLKLANVDHHNGIVSIQYDTAGNLDVRSEFFDVAVEGQAKAKSLRLFARKHSDKIDIAGDTDAIVVQPSNTAIDRMAFVAATSATETQTPVLDITSIKLSAGPTNIEAQGQLEVNAAHNLSGKLTTQTNDIDAVLKLIAPLSGMNDKDAAALKSLLSFQGNDPKLPAQKAEFTAKDGELYWGLMKIGKLDPLY